MRARSLRILATPFRFFAKLSDAQLALRSLNFHHGVYDKALMNKKFVEQVTKEAEELVAEDGLFEDAEELLEFVGKCENNHLMFQYVLKYRSFVDENLLYKFLEKMKDNLTHLQSYKDKAVKAFLEKQKEAYRESQIKLNFTLKFLPKEELLEDPAFDLIKSLFEDLLLKQTPSDPLKNLLVLNQLFDFSPELFDSAFLESVSRGWKKNSPICKRMLKKCEQENAFDLVMFSYVELLCKLSSWSEAKDLGLKLLKKLTKEFAALRPETLLFACQNVELSFPELSAQCSKVLKVSLEHLASDLRSLSLKNALYLHNRLQNAPEIKSATALVLIKRLETLSSEVRDISFKDLSAIFGEKDFELKKTLASKFYFFSFEKFGVEPIEAINLYMSQLIATKSVTASRLSMVKDILAQEDFLALGVEKVAETYFELTNRRVKDPCLATRARQLKAMLRPPVYLPTQGEQAEDSFFVPACIRLVWSILVQLRDSEGEAFRHAAEAIPQFQVILQTPARVSFTDNILLKQIAILSKALLGVSLNIPSFDYREDSLPLLDRMMRQALPFIRNLKLEGANYYSVRSEKNLLPLIVLNENYFYLDEEKGLRITAICEVEGDILKDQRIQTVSWSDVSPPFDFVSFLKKHPILVLDPEIQVDQSGFKKACEEFFEHTKVDFAETELPVASPAEETYFDSDDEDYQPSK